MEIMHLSQEKSHSNGFHWFIASVFIVGETAGSGLVAMPYALMNTGFFGGTFLLVSLCIAMAYTAITLGSNWLIMQRRWPQYAKKSCRDPYPEMARRAMGPIASWLTKFCVYFTTFGGVSVFSILAAKNIADLLSIFHLRVHFCILLAVLGLVLWPFMMLRSPMHFWQVSIVAAASTTLAVLLILFGVSLDFKTCFESAYYAPLSAQSFSLGFGTFVFAYGGHPVLPTIQHDMRNPKRFSKAVILSYIVMFLFYAPVSLFGYSVYGSSMSDSIITSIQSFKLRQAINLLITVHVLFSILIIINPLHQAMEEFCNVKHEFGPGRVVVRTFVFFSAIFTAATVPNFGVFLDLVGGSTMTILALIFPGLFALYLNAGENKWELNQKTGNNNTKQNENGLTILEAFRYNSTTKLILHGTLIVVGVVCGLVSTGNALQQMLQSSLSTPCYVQLYTESQLERPLRIDRNIYCCGEYRNITSGNIDFCHLNLK